MFIIGNLLIAIAKVLDVAFLFLYVVVIAQAVISWVNPDPFNPIVRFLNSITSPVLSWVRSRLPWVARGGIDFSPLVVLLALLFCDQFIVDTLADLGHRLR